MVWAGSRPACLPLPFICLPLLFTCLPVLFICLPGWVLVVGFPAGLSPTSFHLSPTSFHLSPQLACLPLPCICLPFPFICLPLLFTCLPGWLLVVGFPAGLSPSLQLSPTFSPNSLLLGVLNSFLRCVRPLCHCWCLPISTGHVAFLFMCLPGLSLVVSALFRWSCSISMHLPPRSVTAGVRPFSLAMRHLYSSFVSQVCHWWCPPFSAGHAAFLFICLPSLSLLVSALFRWPRNSSIHLFPRPVIGGVRPFPLVV